MTTSRRSFLKASAFASLGGALGATSSVHAADEATLKLPSKWDAETEVLVAGSGIAGMSAAISAMDKNAKVLGTYVIIRNIPSVLCGVLSVAK